ncbi:MAG: sialidase family protein [Candidatus Thorarchaeota archaeon]|jgi:hypothetical protein
MKYAKKLIHLLVVLILLTYLTVPAAVNRDSLSPQFSSSYTPSQEESIEIAGFSDNILISTSDSPWPQHVEPTIAVSDTGVLYAGWKNAETDYGGGARVSFSRSNDGGETWTEPLNMPMYGYSFTRQSDPWLVWHNGTIFYAYLEHNWNDQTRTTNISQITVSRSIDGGNTWDSVSASPSTSSSENRFADKETMTIGADGTIYVAYDDINWIDGGATMRVSKSIDGGASFVDVSIIGEPDSPHAGPYVTLDNNGDLFVALLYHGLRSDPEQINLYGTVYGARSYNGGDSFSDYITIDTDGNFSALVYSDDHHSMSTLPVVRFNQDGRLFFLWADTYPDQQEFDVFLRFSDDFGDTWSDRIRMNPETDGNQWQPDMAVDSQGLLHITYYDEQDGLFRPYYRTVEFIGTALDIPVLSDSIAIAEQSTSSSFTRPGDYFTMRLDSDDRPHVVWTDGRNGELDIYYAHGLTSDELGFTVPVPPVENELVRIEMFLFGLVAVASIGLVAIVIDYRKMDRR